jgi:DNA-binding PadR family transcriptional regulator
MYRTSERSFDPRRGQAFDPRRGEHPRRGGFPPGFEDGRPRREMGRGRGHGRGGHRRGRGDIRAAILALLAERPMHGYEIIQELSERTDGIWRPSPGSIYPTLQLLTDEGLLTSESGSGTKRAYTLTDEGRAEAVKQETPPWEDVAGQIDPQEVELRTAVKQLMSAAHQVLEAGTTAQKTRAIETLNETRRAIYAILGSAE